jgi:TetR/AcrR family transcriptional regulator
MDNRAAILSVALALFAERGYDAVGVQEVVEAAGVTKPTLYHYFGSKQGLLQALLEQHHAPLRAAVREAAVYHGNLPHTLARLGQAFFEAARLDPVYYRMQLALYFAPPGSEAHQLVLDQVKDQYESVEAIFAAAVREHGNMRGRQQLFAAAFIGTLNTCIGLWLNGYAALDEDLLQRALKQYQHGIYS